MQTQTKKDLNKVMADKGFDYYKDHQAKEIFIAYADSHDIDEDRNLNFLCKEPMNGETLIKVMSAAVPAYNDFDGDKSSAMLVETFGNDAEYFVARESSVCIYVRPKGYVWQDAISKIDADEVAFDGRLQMFRIWWD